MSATTDRWGISVAFRLPIAAYHAATREAERAGKSLSRWTRDVLISHLSVGTGEPPVRTWAGECMIMDEMDPTVAHAHFAALTGGRPLPQEFGDWQRAQQIAWLDKEMPL